jgi:hypothetical protein
MALAWIATILSIRRFCRPDQFAGSATRIAARARTHALGLNGRDFRWIWLIGPDFAFLLSRSQY